MLRDAPAQNVDSGRPALLQAVIDAMRIPDLRYRILFTLGILIIFRFLAHVPVPGVDREASRRSAFTRTSRPRSSSRS